MICPHCLSDNPERASSCQGCGRDLGGGPGQAAGKTDGPAPAQRGLFETGQVLAGRFELVRELGRGSLGVVHLARDRELGGKETALKIFYPALRRRPAYLERLTEVVRINQDLTHPGVVSVFDLGGEGDWTFVISEYFPAPSLREIMNRRAAEGRRFTLDEALAVVSPVLEALEYAHHRRTHTDLKPENILVGGEASAPLVKLTDFGTADVLSPALFTTTAQGLGTARYLSPEQVAGERGVGPATDLYAAGVIFYEMLTGQRPRGRFPLPGEIVPGLPVGVDRVTARALGPSPGDRFRNAAEFRDALIEAAQGPPGRPAAPEATLTPGAPVPPVRTDGAGRSWLRLGGQLALGLVALIVVLLAVKFILLGGSAHRTEQVAAFLSQARTAISAGRLDEAGELVRRALKVDRDNIQAKQLWFAIFDRRRRTTRHEDKLKQYLRHGRQAIDRKRPLLAEKIFKNLLVVDPKNLAARAELKRIAQIMTRVQGLLDQARRAQEARRPIQAAKLFGRVLDLDQDNAAAKKGLAALTDLKRRVEVDLTRAEEDLEGRDLFSAWRLFQKVLAQFPSHARARQGLDRIKAMLRPTDIFV
ncbi:MAG: protein kinase, partial [Proteobacteria bacterium]|nr:protein kinase [Pseudomonadota bacterium]